MKLAPHLWQAAASELRAADAIISDPGCDHRLAALHLRRAWEHVARGLGREDALEDEEDELAAWLETRVLHSVAERRRSIVFADIGRIDRLARADLARAPTPDGMSPDALFDHMRDLDRLLRVMREPAAVLPARRVVTWASRAFAWSAVASLLLLLVWRPWQSRGIGPWRGAYYPSEDFRGKPTVRRDLDIDFDWGRGAPIDDIPADGFGVRWDSCLTIAAPTEVTFQLISDDGSRLRIEDEVVIDNWGKHKPVSKSKTVRLEPGTHHLQVDYFDAKFDASVQLFASFDERERPRSIPTRMLQYPRGALGDHNPCRDP